MSLLSRADSLFCTFRQLFTDQKWGAWAVIMLLLSIGSGIIVALQYDYATPWYSTTAIDLLAPYGRFFRALHFYSSQLFFFFSIFHFLAIYQKAKRYQIGEWLQLTASLPVILLLLFTGYVLRGDATGNAAGRIAENLLVAIPLVGESLNSILFALGDSGLRKVYVQHIIGFDLLLLTLLWRHLHIYRVSLYRHPALLTGICAFSMLVAAPLEPEQPGAKYLAGPWFFLGLQELLRYLPPFIAGIVVPLLFICALLSCHPRQKRLRLVTGFLWGWLAGYMVLSIIAFLRK